MSFLSAVGHDFKAIFGWLGSSKGQAVVSGVEVAGQAVATAAGVGAPVSGGIALINSWMNKIITTEAIAAAAGQQNGSGTQKAAAVLTAIQPELDRYFPGTTIQTAQTINTALVTVLNALGTPPAPAEPAASPVASHAQESASK